MTRYEAITSMSKQDLRVFLCDLWLLSSEPDTATGCEHCPMQYKCYTNNIGWGDWLDEEWDDRYTTGVNNQYFEREGHYGE